MPPPSSYQARFFDGCHVPFRNIHLHGDIPGNKLVVTVALGEVDDILWHGTVQDKIVKEGQRFHTAFTVEFPVCRRQR